MASNVEYIPIPFASFQVDRNTFLVRGRSEDAGTHVTHIDALAARVLDRCHGRRTLTQHATVAWHAGLSADPEALRDAFRTLVRARLLRPVGEPRGAMTGHVSHRNAVTAIAVITADRPRLLHRALTAIVASCLRRSDSPALLVVDGSQWSRESETVACDVDAQAPFPITYVGRDRVRCRQAALIAAGIDEDVAAFALDGGGVGANRNVAVLATLGQRILMVDDDVLLQTWAYPDVRPGVLGSGHADERRWQFYPSRTEALSGLATDADHGQIDLLGDIGSCLDRGWLHLDERVDGTNACPHMLTDFTVDTCAIRAAFPGLAGDSGLYCPYHLLFSRGSVKRTLCESHEALTCALSSREVRRAATTTLVTHDPACMGYCMGLSNTVLLPPFMPMGRNEDGVFGSTLSFIHPNALFAHLPFGVVHDSTRPSAYDPAQRCKSATEIRLSEILLSFLDTVRTFSETPHARLAAVAQRYCEIAALAPGSFLEALQDRVLHARAQHFLRLDMDLARTPDSPRHWSEAVEDYRLALVRSTNRPDFWVPVEFADHEQSDALRRTQDFIGRYGALIAAWPDIQRASSAE